MGRESRRRFLGYLGAAGACWSAGCSTLLDETSQDTTTSTETTFRTTRNPPTDARFEFEFSEGSVAVDYAEGPPIRAGRLVIRSSGGARTRWNELGSTAASGTDRITPGATASVSGSVLNWPGDVARSETVRVVYVSEDGSPTTLATFDPRRSGTRTGTDTATAARSGLQSMSTARENWAVVHGSWEFGESVITQTGPDTHRAAFYEGATFSDGRFEVEVNSVDGSEGQHVCFRRNRTDGGHEYYAFGTADLAAVDQTVHLTRVILPGRARDPGNRYDGPSLAGLDVVDSRLGRRLDPETFYTYGVAFEGTSIRTYLDDELVFEVDDAPLTAAGELGLHCGGVTEYRNPRYREM